MEKFKIYVNKIIYPENNIVGVYGLVNTPDRIAKSLATILSVNDNENLKQTALKGKGASMVHSFCQFIVYIQLNSDLINGSIAYFDCENDVDAALEMYNQFSKGGWDKYYKDGFMQEFLIIEKEYDKVKDLAELTEEDF
jgi:hypothetical protein